MWWGAKCGVEGHAHQEESFPPSSAMMLAGTEEGYFGSQGSGGMSPSRI